MTKPKRIRRWVRRIVGLTLVLIALSIVAGINGGEDPAGTHYRPVFDTSDEVTVSNCPSWGC